MSRLRVFGCEVIFNYMHRQREFFDYHLLHMCTSTKTEPDSRHPNYNMEKFFLRGRWQQQHETVGNVRQWKMTH